jgi:hypothetical protein
MSVPTAEVIVYDPTGDDVVADVFKLGAPDSELAESPFTNPVYEGVKDGFETP